jgi:hypothetical protein
MRYSGIRANALSTVSSVCTSREKERTHSPGTAAYALLGNKSARTRQGLQRMCLSGIKAHALARDCSVCTTREYKSACTCQGQQRMRFLRTTAHALLSYNQPVYNYKLKSSKAYFRHVRFYLAKQLNNLSLQLYTPAVRHRILHSV